MFIWPRYYNTTISLEDSCVFLQEASGVGRSFWRPTSLSSKVSLCFVAVCLVLCSQLSLSFCVIKCHSFCQSHHHRPRSAVIHLHLILLHSQVSVGVRTTFSCFSDLHVKHHSCLKLCLALFGHVQLSAATRKRDTSVLRLGSVSQYLPTIVVAFDQYN